MLAYVYDTYIFYAFFILCGLLTAFLIWRTIACYCQMMQPSQSGKAQNGKPDKGGKIKYQWVLKKPVTRQWFVFILGTLIFLVISFYSGFTSLINTGVFWDANSDLGCIFFFLVFLPIFGFGLIILIYCSVAGKHFFRVLYKWKETIVTVCVLSSTLYTAIFAVAWAKYEFEVNRLNNELNVLQILMATDRRKELAAHLSDLTNKKTNIDVRWTSFKQIINVTFQNDGQHNDSGDNSAYTAHNGDIIKGVACIIKAYNDWEGANFKDIILTNESMQKVNFKKTTLHNAKFNNANLEGVDFHLANLHQADFRGVKFGESDPIATLCTAKALFESKFDPHVEYRLRHACPQLLSQESK